MARTLRVYHSVNGVDENTVVIARKADRDDLSAFGDEITRVTPSTGVAYTDIDVSPWAGKVYVSVHSVIDSYNAKIQDWMTPVLDGTGLTLPTDFIAHWPGTITGSDLDEEKATYTATISGLTETPGQVGNGSDYEFNEYASVTGAVIPATGDWTLSTFIRVDAWNAAEDARIFWQNAGGTGRWGIYVNTAGAIKFWADPLAYIMETPDKLTAGEIAHVIVMRSGGYIEIYLNGHLSLRDTYSAANPLEQTDFYLGDTSGNVQKFDGMLNRTRVYTRAVTTDEIVALVTET